MTHLQWSTSVWLWLWSRSLSLRELVDWLSQNQPNVLLSVPQMVWVNDVNVKYDMLWGPQKLNRSPMLCASWNSFPGPWKDLKGGQHPGTLNSDQTESELAQKVPLFPEWDVYNFCFIFFQINFKAKPSRSLQHAHLGCLLLRLCGADSGLEDLHRKPGDFDHGSSQSKNSFSLLVYCRGSNYKGLKMGLVYRCLFRIIQLDQITRQYFF